MLRYITNIQKGLKIDIKPKNFGLEIYNKKYGTDFTELQQMFEHFYNNKTLIYFD